jgi:uncharacterized protein DUF4160
LSDEGGRRIVSDLYAEFEAVIDIRTLEVIRGSLPRRALALVLEWAALHREELTEDWNLCASNQTPRKIQPPGITPAALWRVASIQALAGYCLRVRFVDGTEGMVDLSGLITGKEAGVFAALRNPQVV